MFRLVFLLLILTFGGCSGRDECRSDTDCPTEQVCVASGGVFFGGSECLSLAEVADMPDLQPRTDASDVGLPDTSPPPDISCQAESDEAFCARYGKECGTFSNLDNCGVSREVDCGECAMPNACGGTGIPNVCGCPRTSPDEFCVSQGAECGAVQTADECGYRRFEFCGRCVSGETCQGNECFPDGDLDGVIDSVDNCPETPNAPQQNSDSDGLGDACDNCPDQSNPGQANSDGDDVGDACDPCPDNENDVGPDSDGDGIGDLCDNCPSVPNPAQEDPDHDGDGSACDNDDDGDGVFDFVDNEPNNPTSCRDEDTDGCDDCSRGTADAQNDGVDTDGDGTCDSGDSDMDNDGVDDRIESNPLSPSECADADEDGCDDCTLGVDDFGPEADDTPDNDGPDADGDGICNHGDNCVLVQNPDQADADDDGVGDACED